jgi:hypothetical protein
MCWHFAYVIQLNRNTDRMLLSIFWATIVGCMVTVTAEDSCYAHVHNPYVLFSTYTPYELVHENSHYPVNIPREYSFRHC